MKSFLRFFIVGCSILVIEQVKAQSKVGIVDAESIFSAMPDTRKADSSITAYQKALEADYNQQETDLNAALAKFVKDSATMIPTVKEVNRTSLQNRINELNSRKDQFNKLLNEYRDNTVKPVREKLINSIKEVAKENGFTAVFYKDSAVYFTEAVDITNLVKKKLGIK